jgi:TolA-binding protein
MWGQLTNGAVMLKFISAVIAAAAFAGVLTLLSATSTRLDARPARDAAPQSTPVTQTAPALAAAAISPALVRLDEVVRDLAVMRNSVEQLAAKQEQMAQTIATLQAAEQQASEQQAAKQQAAEQDIIQTRSSPPLSEQVSPPPRKKARRVAPRKLAAQSSSVPPPAFRPE